MGRNSDQTPLPDRRLNTRMKPIQFFFKAEAELDHAFRWYLEQGLKAVARPLEKRPLVIERRPGLSPAMNDGNYLKRFGLR